MEFLNQRQLEDFAEQVEARGIWLQEVGWVRSQNPQLTLLAYLEELVPERETEARLAIDRFSIGVAQMDWNGSAFEDADTYAWNRRTQAQNTLSVSKGWKPLVKSIVSYSGIENPLLLLPFVDYEINFHDQNSFIDGLKNWFPPELIIVLVTGSDLRNFFDNSRIKNQVYCLTDGQYNALRSNKIRKYQSRQIESQEIKTDRKSSRIKIIYTDPVTGFTGEYHSDKSEKVALENLKSEVGFDVDVTEIQNY
jgi:hypothetical protein